MTEKQSAEAGNILKYLKGMEGIVKTSLNEDQKARLQRDIGRYKEKLLVVIPGLDISMKNAERIAVELGIALDISQSAFLENSKENKIGGLLSTIKIKKASLNCNDHEVNFLSTVLNLISRVYWLAISETHCQIDYSYASERDALHIKLENTLRSLRSVTETIEDHAKLEQVELRERLAKIKIRYVRTFLLESDEFMRDVRKFLSVLLRDVESNASIIRNVDERLMAANFYGEAAMIEGKTIREVLMEFHKLCDEAIAYLAVPRLKHAE